MTAIQDQLVVRLQAFAVQQSLQISTPRQIDYGSQIVLSDGTSEVPVNIYTTGRVVVGGKEGPLRSSLKEWAEQHQTQKAAKPARVLAAHIGVDESGKGDVFGPLVIAGALVQPQQSSLLQSLEIRDSKTLTSGRIRELAAWLKERCPAEVLVLTPAEYNSRYPEFNSINRMLGWGHASVIQALQARTGVGLALSDQFSERPYTRQALAEMGCEVQLEERPRAEDDLAVAAASILARAAFEQAFEELRRKSGLALPYGASDPDIPRFLQQIYQRWGEEGLRRSAKVHFKPVQNVLAGS